MSASAAPAVGHTPYTVVSCCVSLDGYLDDASEERLLLSNDADFDRVDAVRAQCDAILVGARTVRRDDPRLQVRSADRRSHRRDRGLPASPVKVTVTSRGELDPSSRFFTVGDGDKLVYCPGAAVARVRARLDGTATVVDAGALAGGGQPASDAPVDLYRVAADLRARGVGRLLVEGGGAVHTQFLTAGLADELQLAVAPFFVGDARAPRFVHDGAFPWGPDRPAPLAEVRRMGDVVLLRYALSERFGTSPATA